jgi:hypothetical protein
MAFTANYVANVAGFDTNFSPPTNQVLEVPKGFGDALRW